MAADHPWTQFPHISALDLSLTPLLVREAGSGTKDTIELALRRKGLRLLTGLQVASNTALKSAAIAGMGPAVISVATVADEVAHGQLFVVSVDDLHLSRPLSPIWRDETVDSPLRRRRCSRRRWPASEHRRHMVETIATV